MIKFWDFFKRTRRVSERERGRKAAEEWLLNETPEFLLKCLEVYGIGDEYDAGFEEAVREQLRKDQQ